MYVRVCIMDLPALRLRFTYEHCVMYFCRCNVRKSEDDSNITILRATKVNYKSIYDVINETVECNTVIIFLSFTCYTFVTTRVTNMM